MIQITDTFILEEAVEDLNNGRHFYDQRELGIGDYFWDSLITDIESLKIYAGIHNKKYELYRMFSKRFPYAIYYEIEQNNAYIVAILPMKRDPDWILRQVKERTRG